jgi:hypothetical protein
MKKKILYPALLCSATLFALTACKKDDPIIPAPTVVKEWTIPLSAKNENPSPAGRSETGNAALQLLSDNSLKYTINVTGLATGDALVAAHIHVGNVISNGAVILGLDPVFTGSTATGTLKDLRSTFIDSLKDNVNELYFNVHSTQVPGGLVRGQLNIGIDFAGDVLLSGANESPAVATTATGIALLRLTADKKLYSKVTITDLETGDALKFAHVHNGPAGVNGPVIINLCEKAEDFGTAKSATLDDANFSLLKTGTLYVNAHSVNHGGGIVRGQIR